MRIRQVAASYLFALSKAGIPYQDAEVIAWAIANFDKASKLPNLNQAKTLAQYRLAIKDAELWKPAFEEVINAIAA